jgi:hypothetical protein
MPWPNSLHFATDNKHLTVGLYYRSTTGLKRLTAILLALLLSLSVSLLAIPTQANGPDGYNWAELTGNPVFSGTSRAYYPCVIKVDTTYHMWYTDYSSGHYVVGHTTSADGTTWATPTIVSGLTGHPAHTVVVNIGTDASPHYRMWYGDEATPWPYNPSCFRTAESYDSQGETWINDQAIGQVTGYELLTGDWAGHPWQYGSYGPGGGHLQPIRVHHCESERSHGQ